MTHFQPDFQKRIARRRLLKQCIEHHHQWLSSSIHQQTNPSQTTLQMFSLVGYKYHLDSVLVKRTQDRWQKQQDLILRIKSEYVLTVRCWMLLIGLLLQLASINREMWSWRVAFT